MKMKSSLLAVTAFAGASASLSAETVFFDDGVYSNGAEGYSNYIDGTDSIVDSSSTLFEYEGGQEVIQIDLAAAYKNGGIEIDPLFTVTSAETTLIFDIFVDTVASNWMSGFALRIDTGNFSTVTDDWFISDLDGSNSVAGTNAGLTGGEWHRLSFDLTTATDFVADTSKLGKFVAITASAADPTATFYVGNVSLIPEPSSFAMLAGALALGAVMIRRRRS